MKKLAFLALVLATACAKQPDQIAAADIGPNPYMNYSCSKLSAEKLKLEQALETLSAEQKNAAAGDAVGVFLLGLPVSSMSGNDKETAIAVAKGRIHAVDTRREARKCK